MTGTNSACKNADSVCYSSIEGPFCSVADFDVYHIRAPNKDRNPPETYLSYLQTASVVKAIGTQSAYHTRALVTFLDRTPDKNTVSSIATLDPSADFMFSSWAKLDCYELDFHLGLGKPDAVRRPRFEPVESLIYLMPRTLDGKIAAVVCLRDEDMERLRADEEFPKYERYIA